MRYIGGELELDWNSIRTQLELDWNSTVNSDEWYTLSGVKLEGKPTVKGVYIYNGKKVAIK